MATFLGENDSVLCLVVTNANKQYSIWPNGRELPSGWFKEGFGGTRSECLKYIDRVWTEPTAHDATHE
ncbi:MbtH family protein [Xenorhabdus sp. Reich]|uniref:MbtH family protein n=1 Tax=Xenorhabdus littoralis TaxID=2582835 RepID=A0ABU4SL54_9GAMM|nr:MULTISPECIES: MbtH family NRPS accessory protein [unclassified Xenorhabdus]MDX7990723.1 MbtH family protein [Xenorhabdus sp. psl]MDX7999382.1 MbtH family protein [Xenorhabdus sp. Reich]